MGGEPSKGVDAEYVLDGWGEGCGIDVCMKKIAMKRPFAVVKLKQGARLVWESHQEPMRGVAGQPVETREGELGVMFLGHSSFLLQMAGANVLIDPVFATRLIVLRRQRRPGVKVPDLPAIDLVLLTHAHMDHLNRPTLRRIIRATRRKTGRPPIVVVPQGVEDLVQDLGFREVRSMTWWGQMQVAGLDVTFTPAKHWGARMFADTHRCFGGYVIVDSAGHRVYHSGDTAYFDGFKEIGAKLRPQVALLPIGAYFPDTYRAVHTSPEEGLQAFVDVGAETMIPMHYGTFKLGREPMEEPPIRLMADAEKRGIADKVRILAEGETFLAGPQQPAEARNLSPPAASNGA
jgi:L-ascorbate metabolism protein UlaG (beta-lactamase superfamily)